jgi:hypothetical protein
MVGAFREGLLPAMHHFLLGFILLAGFDSRAGDLSGELVLTGVDFAGLTRIKLL